VEAKKQIEELQRRLAVLERLNAALKRKAQVRGAAALKGGRGRGWACGRKGEGRGRLRRAQAFCWRGQLVGCRGGKQSGSRRSKPRRVPCQ
jgi:hypothetical protein